MDTLRESGIADMDGRGLFFAPGLRQASRPAGRQPITVAFALAPA
jgi:hypothetical protein